MCLLKIVTERNDILFQNVEEMRFDDDKIIAFDMLRRKREFIGKIHSIDAEKSVVTVGLKETAE